MSINFKEALGVSADALQLRAERTRVLAANIANESTPGYTARDIDFASALQNAMAGGKNAGAMNTTNNGHIPRGAATGDTLANGTPVLYRGVVQGSVDGNTVDMDVERNQFADNALRYEAGIMMINSQLKGLMTALQSQ